jgi:class 3 adenylate cyclase
MTINACDAQVLVDQSTRSSLLVAGSQNQSGILKGTIFVDMGHHQLKGITTTTRIFQVRASTTVLLWAAEILLIGDP